MITLVGYYSMGGLDKYVTWHNSELFSFLALIYLQRAPRSHFLTDQDDLYAKTRFRPRICLLGVSTISDYI